MEPQLNAAYWDERYQQHQTELGQKDLRILVPGCGNGYEVVIKLPVKH